MKLKEKYRKRFSFLGKFVRFAMDHLDYSMEEVTKYEYLCRNEKILISEKMFNKYFTQNEH